MLLAFSAMVFKRMGRGEPLTPRSRLDLVLGLLLVLALGSCYGSIYRVASAWALGRMVLYIGVFYLTLDMARSRTETKWLFLTIVGTGTAVAVIGFIKYQGGVVPAFWEFGTKGEGIFLTSTFMNHNHAAGYLAMVLCLVLGVSVYRCYGHPLLLGTSLVLILVALCLTMSRGGWIASFVALECMSVAFLLKKGTSRFRIWGTALVLCIGVGLTLLASDAMIDRLQSIQNVDEPSLVSRLAAWRGCTELLRRNPLLGTGLGTFPWSFPQVRPAGLFHRYREAHNDYLQIVTEVGLPVVIPLLWGLSILFGAGLRRFRRTRSRFRAGITLGALGGIVAILVHNLSDFNTQITANGVLLSVAAGLPMGDMTRARRHSSAGTDVGSRRLVVCLAVVTLLALTSFHLARFALADVHASIGERELAIGNYRKAGDHLTKSIQCDGHTAEYRYAYAQSLYARARESGSVSEMVGLLERATYAYHKAIDLNPLEGSFWFGLGQTSWWLATVDGEGDEVGSFFLEAVARDPNNGKFLYGLISYYLSTGEPDRCEKHIRRLALVYPDAYRHLRDQPGWREELGVSYEDVLEGATRSPMVGTQALGVLAFMSAQRRNWAQAAGYTEEMIERAGSTAAPRWYIELARYYLKLGKDSHAKEAFSQALERSGEDEDLLCDLLRTCRNTKALGLWVEIGREFDESGTRTPGLLALLLGKAYFYQHDFASARRHLRRSLAWKETAEAHGFLAEIALKRKHWDTAELESQRAITLQPDNGHYYYLFARSLKAQEKYGSALDAIDEAIHYSTAPAHYYGTRGWLHWELHSYDEAIQNWKTACRLAPEDARYPLWIARAYRRIKDYPTATSFYLTALGLQPENRRLLAELETVRKLGSTSDQ
jgi:tetratricopeptide (TPR) repeat protein/O-antigen ligase